MPLIAACSNCGKQYRVAEQNAGKTLQCRECKGPVPVPPAEDDLPAYDSPVSSPAPHMAYGSPAGYPQVFTARQIFAMVMNIIGGAACIIYAILTLISIAEIQRISRTYAFSRMGPPPAIPDWVWFLMIALVVALFASAVAFTFAAIFTRSRGIVSYSFSIAAAACLAILFAISIASIISRIALQDAVAPAPGSYYGYRAPDHTNDYISIVIGALLLILMVLIISADTRLLKERGQIHRGEIAG